MTQTRLPIFIQPTNGSRKQSTRKTTNGQLKKAVPHPNIRGFCFSQGLLKPLVLAGIITIRVEGIRTYGVLCVFSALILIARYFDPLELSEEKKRKQEADAARKGVLVANLTALLGYEVVKKTS